MDAAASSLGAFLDRFDIRQTAEFVRKYGYKRVALQFPDELLLVAPDVADALSDSLGSGHQVYVLADTAYNPLAVDEVAAAHVSAGCLVHYGRASLATAVQLPTYYVFPKHPIDCTAAAKALHEGLEASPELKAKTTVLLLVDQVHAYKDAELAEAVQSRLKHTSMQVVLAELDIGRRGVPGADLRGSSLASAGCQAGSQRPSGSCGASVCCATSAEPCDAAQASSAPDTCNAICTASGDTTAPSPSQGQDACSALGPSNTCIDNDQSPTKSERSGSGGGYCWKLPEGCTSDQDCVFAWVGCGSAGALQLLQLAYSSAAWLTVEIDGEAESSSSGSCTGVTEGLTRQTQVLLKRRYYLVEKAKGANIIGILVGTLATAGFKQMVELIRRLAQEAGKKTYTLLIGKPAPAKLANFPEVEAFVMVADPQGFVLDSKDFLAPIITPHEAVLAFTNRSLVPGSRYILDFQELLQSEHLLKGSRPEGQGADGGCSLVLRSGMGALQISSDGQQQAVVASNAAEYLQLKRTYQGLQTPLTGAEEKAASVAVQGRAGRAAGYADEPTEE